MCGKGMNCSASRYGQVGAIVIAIMKLRVPKRRRDSCLAGNRLASQEGLSSMRQVSK